jgi:hypothetical protein
MREYYKLPCERRSMGSIGTRLNIYKVSEIYCSSIIIFISALAHFKINQFLKSFMKYFQ